MHSERTAEHTCAISWCAFQVEQEPLKIFPCHSVTYLVGYTDIHSTHETHAFKNIACVLSLRRVKFEIQPSALSPDSKCDASQWLRKLILLCHRGDKAVFWGLKWREGLNFMAPRSSFLNFSPSPTPKKFLGSSTWKRWIHI